MKQYPQRVFVSHGSPDDWGPNHYLFADINEANFHDNGMVEAAVYELTRTVVISKNITVNDQPVDEKPY